MKKYTVRFYTPRYGADGAAGSIFSDLLTYCKKEDGSEIIAPIMPAGDTAYQIRGLINSLDGVSISGYLVRFRLDKPAVGSKSSLDEEYLELDGDKEFIEKNHFVLFKEKSSELMCFQCCREGAVISVLGRYLTFLNNESETISFDDILTRESLDIIFNKGLIKSVEFSIMRPLGKKYKPNPNDTWTQESFEILNGVGGNKFTAKIAITAKELGLLDKTKNKIKNLIKSEYTKKLKVKVSGEAEPIDLLAERISGKINVPVQPGGIIKAEDIYHAIRDVKDQKQHHIDANYSDE
ncbi:hypothetical protein B9475_002355 [Proteus mirabilis]|nr:hypothetical protein B9475_002355 [Proteus mirabilis]